MSQTHTKHFATDLKQTSNRPPVLDKIVVRFVICPPEREREGWDSISITDDCDLTVLVWLTYVLYGRWMVMYGT